ncbi:MAG: DUF721 domain-containing protein [Ignavibacteriaceae bacterium]|nr:DUF721 domain-containing protein [Ignavibacteriaceae bacterium]
MHNGFMSLSEVFNTDPALARVRKLVKESDVAIEFSKLFPDLEKVAEAVRVEQNVLILRVENAAWRNELKFKEGLIIEKVNDYFKETRINRVKFIF